MFYSLGHAIFFPFHYCIEAELLHLPLKHARWRRTHTFTVCISCLLGHTLLIGRDGLTGRMTKEDERVQTGVHAERGRESLWYGWAEETWEVVQES